MYILCDRAYIPYDMEGGREGGGEKGGGRGRRGLNQENDIIRTPLWLECVPPPQPPPREEPNKNWAHVKTRPPGIPTAFHLVDCACCIAKLVTKIATRIRKVKKNI